MQGQEIFQTTQELALPKGKLTGLLTLDRNKDRRKAIFNWAAKGLFFLRGSGDYTHSGYYKTLSPTNLM